MFSDGCILLLYMQVIVYGRFIPKITLEIVKLGRLEENKVCYMVQVIWTIFFDILICLEADFQNSYQVKLAFEPILVLGVEKIHTKCCKYKVFDPTIWLAYILRGPNESFQVFTEFKKFNK